MKKESKVIIGILLVLFLIIVLSLATAREFDFLGKNTSKYSFSTNGQSISDILAEPEEDEQEQPTPERKEELVKKVSKYIAVPNEVPIVFEITEPQIEYFKDNEEYPLLKNVNLGDVVMIFLDESKILVYREAEDKVISYGVEKRLNELIEVELSSGEAGAKAKTIS